VSIGDVFLEGYGGNSQITPSSNLESIGACFMQYSQFFNKPITIPKSVTHVGVYFMHRAEVYTNTITINAPASAFDESPYTLSAYDTGKPLYTTGPLIAGTYAAEFKERFPNSVSPPRHLR
jgi:hypothetical protein